MAETPNRGTTPALAPSHRRPGEPVDVIIAGAGPVGLSAALALGKAGRSVVVVTDGPGLSTESRASTFHAPTLEILHELGLADEVVRRGLKAPEFQFRDRGGGVVASFDMTELADLTAFPFRIQLQQSHYTPLVVDALRELPNVTVLFDSPVTSVHQLESSVHVVAGPHDLAGEWLIGADGAHSAVRRELDVAFEGITYEDRYLVASTTNDFRQLLPDLAHVNYIADPREYLVLLNTPQAWRALFRSATASPTKRRVNQRGCRSGSKASRRFRVATTCSTPRSTRSINVSPRRTGSGGCCWQVMRPTSTTRLVAWA